MSFKSHLADFYNENKKHLPYYAKRDNCGVAAIDYIMHRKKHGEIGLKKVEGTFIADVPVYKKLDFEKHELKDMSDKGYNVNDIQSRKQYAEDHGLVERQKQIPHTWVEDSSGNIIDPSGKMQFLDTKLSKDLNINRYKPEKKIPF